MWTRRMKPTKRQITVCRIVLMMWNVFMSFRQIISASWENPVCRRLLLARRMLLAYISKLSNLSGIQMAMPAGAQAAFVQLPPQLSSAKTTAEFIEWMKQASPKDVDPRLRQPEQALQERALQERALQQRALQELAQREAQARLEGDRAFAAHVREEEAREAGPGVPSGFINRVTSYFRPDTAAMAVTGPPTSAAQGLAPQPDTTLARSTYASVSSTSTLKASARGRRHQAQRVQADRDLNQFM